MWDQITKRIFDILKILAIVVPTVVSGYAYFNSEVLLKGVSDNLKPAITAQITEEMPAAVELALTQVVIQTRLDSLQMNGLELLMMDYQNATLAQIPIEVGKQFKLADKKLEIKTHKVFNQNGDHIENLIGVRQKDGSWFVYLEKIEQ